MKGHALLIGVNKTDFDHYNDENQLSCAEKDILAMENLLSGIPEFSGNITSLTNESASWSCTTDYIQNTVQKIKNEPSYLLIYFTGHGASYNDEGKKHQGFFCFHDKMVLENQIKELLMSLKHNVKTFIITDSCHSGELTAPISGKRNKVLDNNICLSVRNKRSNKEYYDSVISQYSCPESTDDEFNPNSEVCILTACSMYQKAEYSADSISDFTDLILSVWHKKLQHGYDNFCTLLREIGDNAQTPQLSIFGKDSGFFKHTIPFIINFSDVCIEDLKEEHLSEPLNVETPYILMGLPTSIIKYTYIDQGTFTLAKIPVQYEGIMSDLLDLECQIGDIVFFTVVEVKRTTATSSAGFPVSLPEVIKKSPTSSFKQGYVIIYDKVSQTIIHKGRTKGKVSNTIGG